MKDQKDFTPEEKAKELINCFEEVNRNSFTAHSNALKCVDEIIESRKEDLRFDDTLLSHGSSEYYRPNPMYLTYWKQVKAYIIQSKK